jgi:receptor expression-enhancing protein 5/6
LIILLLLWSVGNFCRYASIKAIESPFKEDDQLWLTYWVLYSFVTLLELVAAPVIAWYSLVFLLSNRSLSMLVRSVMSC